MSGCKTFVTEEAVKVDHMAKRFYCGKNRFFRWILAVSLTAGTVPGLHAQGAPAGLQKAINLPTSKQLLPPAPGDPRRVNSLPLSLAASPDGQWVVAINAGYGTYESNYGQSLAVLSVASGAVKDFPDPRVGERAAQTFFSGLAFSADGTKVYASLASISSPEGDGHDKVGNGIVVYGFSQGVLTPQGFLKLPMVKLGPGKTSGEQKGGDPKLGIPYPAAIVIVPGATERLLVAENLSDTVVLLDAKSGTIEKSFDLSETDAVPSTYPIALAVTKDGGRAFVAL